VRGFRSKNKTYMVKMARMTLYSLGELDEPKVYENVCILIH